MNWAAWLGGPKPREHSITRLSGSRPVTLWVDFILFIYLFLIMKFILYFHNRILHCKFLFIFIDFLFSIFNFFLNTSINTLFHIFYLFWKNYIFSFRVIPILTTQFLGNDRIHLLPINFDWSCVFDQCL